MQAHIDKLIYRIFIFLLIFSPLAFGAVSTWSLTIMETLSIGSAILLFLYYWVNGRKIYRAPGTLLIMIYLGYILLQLIPLPAGLVKLISPSTYSLYAETIGIVEPVKWISLSINKKETLSELFRYISYATFYLLTVQLLSSGDLLKKTLKYLVIFAAILSVVTILQRFTSPDKIYWFYDARIGATGPYFNRNHYAGLMEMIFPVVFSLFLFYKPSVSYTSLREKIVEFFSQIRTSNHILLGFACILVALSVFMSASRGGIISLCVSFIFFYMMIALKNRKSGSSGKSIILILFLVFISISWLGWDPIFKRFDKTINEQGELTENRPIYWKDSMNSVRDFPLTGTGMGTFDNIYPKYQSKAFGKRVNSAHNDYIEFLVNGGIAGFLLFFGILATIIYKTYRVFLKRREPYSVLIYIGSISGILAILLHSITDFNLQIGANGLYLFFLLGLAVSASHTRMREGLGNTLLKPMTSGIRIIYSSGVACLLLILPLVILFNAGMMRSEPLFLSSLELVYAENLSEEDKEKLYQAEQKMIKANPFDYMGHWLLAKSAVENSDNDAALDYFKKAIRRNPVSGTLLQDFGKFMADIDNHEAAKKLILAGITFNPMSSRRYLTYAEWLLEKGEKDIGLDTMRTVISMDVRRSRTYIDLMDGKGLSLDDIMHALPDKVEPHLYYAEYLMDKEMQPLAEETYLRAFNYLDNKEEVNPNCFVKASRYFTNQKQYDEALNIMLKGIEYLPDNAKIRIGAASLYEKIGIQYRAIEEYKNALILDPKNRSVRKKLKTLEAT